MRHNTLDEITISIFNTADGDYQFDIYSGSPEDVVDGKEPEDGGLCTSDMANAIGMSCDQAKDLITQNKRNGHSLSPKKNALKRIRELGELEKHHKHTRPSDFKGEKNYSRTKEQLAIHKKPNTMNTQTEKPKNEKPVSRLYLVETGTWKNGQEVITFYYKNDEGKPKAIAHSFVYYDKEGQTFRTQDAKGAEIFPPCNNRYDLKKYALDNEQELIQKFEKTQGQEHNSVQQNPPTTKQPEQVQQPVNNPEQSKQPVRQKNNRRKNELGEMRNEKENEKGQNLSR